MAVRQLELRCTVRSHVGRRPNNEDCVFASPRMAVVADGVGGAAAGEVASRMAVNAFIALDKLQDPGPITQSISDAVSWSNDAIRLISSVHNEWAGMATTLTAVSLHADGSYVVANVGDSRTYLLRDGELRRLTRDESLVQQLIDAGQLTDEEAQRHPHRSVVLRAIDGSPSVPPTLTTVNGRAGDRLLLCSDGLSDVVTDDVIHTALVGDADDCATNLVALAFDGGSRDNISLVVADVVSSTNP